MRREMINFYADLARQSGGDCPLKVDPDVMRLSLLVVLGPRHDRTLPGSGHAPISAIFLGLRT